MKKGYYLTWAGTGAIAAMSEIGAATDGTGGLLSSTVCMSAFAFAAILMTPTATLGEVASKAVRRFGNGVAKNGHGDDDGQ